MFERLSNAFSSLVNRLVGEKQLTGAAVDPLLAKVHDALIDADVPYEVAQRFLATLRGDITGTTLVRSLKAEEQIMKIVHDAVLKFLGGSSPVFAPGVPSTIMLIGLQGSGKTTSLVKLAHYLHKEAQKKSKKQSILVASIDFYRPAAIDQLEIAAKAAGIDFYRSSQQSPTSVLTAAQEIAAYAKAKGYDYLFLDTAGRLHVDTAMLEELEKVSKIVNPRHTFIVLDAMMGQQSLAVAKAFNEAVGFDAALLTKMDSDTRGGVAFAFRYILNKPILFIGTGEKVGDLEAYKPERIATRMLGMGDLVSLAEQAAEKIKASERKKAEESFAKGVFTLEDFASQLGMMNQLGSLAKLANYLPGFAGAQLSPAMIAQGELMMKKYRAILSSMTAKERLAPSILNGSRKQRIARGAGVSLQDVHDMMNRFEQTQQFVKLMKMGGKNRFF